MTMLMLTHAALLFTTHPVFALAFSPNFCPPTSSSRLVPTSSYSRQRVLHSSSTVLFSGKGFGKPAASTASSAIATSNSARDDALKSLLEWSAKNSISRGKGVTVSPSSKNVGGGVGVRINRKTKAGSEVMRIPYNMILSSRELQLDLSEEASDVVLNSLKEDGLDTYASEFFLMLRVLEVYVAHKTGIEDADEYDDFGPWLESLPTTFDMGIYFDSTERSYLPQLAAKLLDLQERQLAAFRKAFSALVDQEERYQVLTSSDKDDIVKWAFSIVFSRSWRSPSNPDDARIVPIADCFNHGDSANVIVEEPEGAYGPTEVLLKSDVDKDTELLLSYGPGYDPSRFLVIFGFYDETVEEVFCGVAINGPSDEQIELGCTDRSKMIYRSDGAIANSVWDTVLYTTLSQVPEEQQLFFEAYKSGDAEQFQALHRKYRLEVAAALRNHAEQVLATEYRVPSDKELASINIKEHRRLNMILRHNRFMRRVFETVKARLEQIISMEVDKRRKLMQEEEEEDASSDS